MVEAKCHSFANYLNSINYGGTDEWRLPEPGPNLQADYNNIDGEFGQLFYTELGGTAGYSIPNTATFNNEQDWAYRLNTERTPNLGNAWPFGAYNGYQGGYGKTGHFFAWAVSPGQVSAVPVPAAAWLFGVALFGILPCISWRKANYRA